MEILKIKVKIYLILIIIVSILFAFGVPAIIFGALNSNWGLMIVGIIFSVIGFNCIPIFSVNLATAISYQKIIKLVKNGTCKSLKDFRGHISRACIKRNVALCIGREYLTGYKLESDGTIITTEERQKRQQEQFESNKTNIIKCENCGKDMKIKGKVGKCEYCGKTLELKK